MFFNLIFHKFTTKILAILFLAMSATIHYFEYSYGIRFDLEMLNNTLKTDIYETKELISTEFILYIIFVIILPSIIIAKTKITYDPIKKYLLKKAAIIFSLTLILIVTLFFSYSKMAVFFRVNRDVQHFLTPANYIHTIKRAINRKIHKNIVQIIEPMEIEFKNDKDLVVVLVIGETARKDNFSLYGYKKETNPLLKKQKDLMVFQNMIACGTNTAVSVPCMLEVDKSHENIIKTLSKTGLKIKWYDNNYGGCYGNCSEIENVATNHSKCKDSSCVDEVIFEQFFSDLKNYKTGKSFFILHQNGSHGPLYYKRYPKEFAKFKPECKTSQVNKCSQEELINAYDNTILYTDYLLNKTIEKLKESKKNAVMIYISDHGESLGENGIFLHGFPYKIAPKEQKEVPFLIWSSKKINANLNKKHHQGDLSSILMKILEVKSSFYEKKKDI
jgi:lipid A ethanolaminephosphotransferase